MSSETNNSEEIMTHHEYRLRQAYHRSGLGLIGFTFAQAMAHPAIRISLECKVKDETQGKSAPVQPALI